MARNNFRERAMSGIHMASWRGLAAAGFFAAGFAGLAAPCWASTVSATESNVSFQVLDLTPDDHRMAGYTLFNGDTSLWNVIDVDQQTLQVRAYFADLSVANTVGDTMTASAVTANGLSSEGAFHDGHDIRSQADTSSNGPVSWLLLRPQTQLVVSLDYALSVGVQACDSFCDQGLAWVKLWGGDSNTGEQVLERSIMLWAPQGSPAQSQSEAGTLAVTLTNNTDQVEQLALGFETEVQGYSVSPVPEPATPWLMLLGFGGLLWMRRRAK
jgi:hypothetical protein